VRVWIKRETCIRNIMLGHSVLLLSVEDFRHAADSMGLRVCTPLRQKADP
jgi:hypothetical protein